MATSLTGPSCICCGCSLTGLYDFTGRVTWVCYACTAEYERVLREHPTPTKGTV